MNKLVALPIPGESFLLRRGNKNILIDGGYSSRALSAALSSPAIAVNHLDIVVCTHADKDHAGGLTDILENSTIRIEEFWLPGAWSDAMPDLLQNTHGDNQVPGCHNGGPVRTKEGRNQKDIHDPVPGGVRNCCRCRWSASGKEHLDSLAATLTNRSWHLQNASNEALATLRERDAILKSKARTEAANEPFGQTHDLTSAERRHEAAMHRMQELTLDVAALNRTIDRVMALPVNVDGPTVLALQGDALTAHAVIEDASELLQLANVVGDMELYPDLQSNTGEAVYAYADLLDNAFECEGHPRILVRLSKDEKMQCANALMRQLERHANPQNHLLGRRAVVEIIDRGESLQKLLGVKLNEIARQALPAKNQTPLRLVKPTTEDDHDDRRAS